MDIDKLVRPNILRLKPYSCARDEFKGEAKAFLDANENAYMHPYNRYPDPLNMDLKEVIAGLYGGVARRIFLGVGSDECIDMVYRVFCRPGVDNVVAIDPTYGMYSVCASINDVEYRSVPLNDDFSIDEERLLASTDVNTKALWVCSPNNPTGNSFSFDELRPLLERFDGLVVVDEAYGDFNTVESMIGRIDDYPNLIVLRTFSKAWGHAAIRLGMAFASEPIVDLFNKVKYPYNINILTRRRALEVLADADKVKALADEVIAVRERLASRLRQHRLIKSVYPSQANFLLVKVDDADALYGYLSNCGVVVRNRHRVNLCDNCLRITVGTPKENDLLLSALDSYDGN